MSHHTWALDVAKFYVCFLDPWNFHKITKSNAVLCFEAGFSGAAIDHLTALDQNSTPAPDA